MENNRYGYGFSHADKEMVHQRGGNSCEFPGYECDKPNTGIVNHITGVAEARLANMDKRAVSDPNLNAVLLCTDHELQHDLQEQFQVAMLRNEQWKAGGPNLHERRHKPVRNARHQRRRRR